MHTLKMHTLKLLATTVSVIALSACGGGSSSGGSNGGSSSGASSSGGSQVQLTVATQSKLKRATSSELETHIKNGISYQVYDQFVAWEAVDDAIATPEAAPQSDSDSSSSSSSGSGNYSSTNTYVVGVDEGDYLKYDGDYLYTVQYSEYNNAPTKVRILASSPSDASASLVSEIELDSYATPSLYLVDNGDPAGSKLLALSSEANYYSVAPFIDVDVEATSLPYYTSHSAVKANLYDLADPANPALDFALEIDGYLQTSRKVGDYLYLVLNHNTSLIYYELHEAENEGSDKNSYSQKTLDELLPHYTINGGTPQPLLTGNDCYVPSDITANHGYHSLVSVVAINLAEQAITSSTCINSPVEGIYMTPTSLYVGANSWYTSQLDAPVRQESGNGADVAVSPEPSQYYSVVHKFTVADGAVTYRATGAVEGQVNWYQAGFFVNESSDYLRVISSDTWSGVTYPHKLTVLKDTGENNDLIQVAQIPNAEQPAPIGKPGEEIYGTRFVNDRAYIVTFMRTDPLYVVDLTNNEAPAITGELEIPGFSAYLHSVSDNYLLGVGYNVDPDSPWAERSGVKVSLYDVSDITNPAEINNYIIGGKGSGTSAIHDLHALTFLQTNDDTLRFTLPISKSENYNWQGTNLELFEVNNITTSAGLNHAGSISPTSDSNAYSYWSDRAAMHDDTVYYSHNGNIWSAFWQTPSQANGPH